MAQNSWQQFWDRKFTLSLLTRLTFLQTFNASYISSCHLSLWFAVNLPPICQNVLCLELHTFRKRNYSLLHFVKVHRKTELGLNYVHITHTLSVQTQAYCFSFASKQKCDWLLHVTNNTPVIIVISRKHEIKFSFLTIVLRFSFLKT